ncbi:MAG: cutinase family protein, partial [Actinomycetota bacterium]|nr:cutinase family protein [Actinomycetota bacterium]
LLMDPTASSTPTASADGCPDVEVVFARGTSEPPGLGRVGDGLVNALRNQTSRSVGAYAVNYPASYDFGRAADGANDASGHVMWMVENCPATRLVLGGYSQGAAIVDIVAAAPVPGFGFTAPLPPEAADHVAAIAVFGNPSNKIGQPLTNSPVYGFKTIDLCTDGDPVCSPGRMFSAHSGYTPGMTNQAASFVAGLL